MTRKTKISKWAETAFQFNSELWRAKTIEGMVVLGKLPDGTFTLHRFNDEGGKLTHISESEALWLTLDLAPEKMNCIQENIKWSEQLEKLEKKGSAVHDRYN